MRTTEAISTLRKGRKVIVKANQNVASVTASRVLGKGCYRTKFISPKQTEVKRLA
jgi:hypothetical protein